MLRGGQRAPFIKGTLPAHRVELSFITLLKVLTPAKQHVVESIHLLNVVENASGGHFVFKALLLPQLISRLLLLVELEPFLGVVSTTRTATSYAH